MVDVHNWYTIGLSYLQSIIDSTYGGLKLWRSTTFSSSEVLHKMPGFPHNFQGQNHSVSNGMLLNTASCAFLINI